MQLFFVKYKKPFLPKQKSNIDRSALCNGDRWIAPGELTPTNCLLKKYPPPPQKKIPPDKLTQGRLPPRELPLENCLPTNCILEDYSSENPENNRTENCPQ